MTRVPPPDDGSDVLTSHDKGLPARAAGETIADFLATSPDLAEFWTPLVVLDDEAMAHNVAVMAQWTRVRGLELMPHGKTTMAPALWRRQLDAGSLGITLATMGQVRTARSLGFDSIMLANAAVDARALRYLAGELADPGLRFVCWVDSVETVEAMERALVVGPPPRRLDVCVELGAPGGRTGARTVAEATRVAERVAASAVLRLAGVAGYEGSLAHDRSEASLRAVRDYLERQVELHESIRSLYDDGEVYVTAGGSAYFDVVADVYRNAGAESASGDSAGAGGARTHFVLRSGAYIVHDDGYYRTVSPFDGSRASEDSPRLVSAMRGIARVVSHPEPGLALLDGGKRDFPYDEGLPIPRGVAADLDGPWAPLTDATVSAMNDQHSYLRLDGADAARGVAPIGSLVALGLSHPCTAFDKWRVLPVVESADSTRVVDLVRTYF
ncbi:amino acid aldolase [Planctomonas sp. JC2975]|uniref:alanine racemase n=1 Tax=Planctomonas sp. JC2975 TaxID=2729626 RepID=UPI00147289CC|nr:alanine racemase [Planctomonas sp. JC2975]NNC11529.1 amino acid aldolase [Planctomonas sp. JC2975]